MPGELPVAVRFAWALVPRFAHVLLAAGVVVVCAALWVQLCSAVTLYGFGTEKDTSGDQYKVSGHCFASTRER